jgi:hypothetical protein
MTITGNQLPGTLPDAIANISGLALLDLSYNLLMGTIPKTIGLLTELLSLNLEVRGEAGRHSYKAAQRA